jgi:flagellar basal-body rod protein FlgG
MQSGFYTATGGMVAQFNRLDTVSNNLANLNTTSFKRDGLVFGDYLRITQESREMNNEVNQIRNHTRDGARFLNRAVNKTPHIVEDYTDFSLGSFKETGNDLDFVLKNENLFFAVLSPDGIKLTRDGNFSLDKDGNLVTQKGYYVLSNEFKNGVDPKDSLINLPTNTSLASDENGILNAVDSNGVKVPLYQIFIGEVENKKYLSKEANNLYKLNNLSELSSVENSRSVMQGYIETSNVNAVSEMTSLIETQRLVDMYQKVMKTHMDDLNTDAVTKLAKSKT